MPSKAIVRWKKLLYFLKEWEIKKSENFAIFKFGLVESASYTTKSILVLFIEITRERTEAVSCVT